MTDPAPLPVTVVSGYLGAGKTSLINHLLRNAGGRRILVLVNDFGEINIDADLLESAEEDVLTLSNGCVCCSLGGDLYYALADALDRRPRPDCLVIEASGVAQPQKIAQAALAEPEMRYCGVVTLVDAVNVGSVLADPLIGAQVADQITSADLIVVTKSDLAEPIAALAEIDIRSGAPVIVAQRAEVAPDIILDRRESTLPATAREDRHDHGEVYRTWSYSGPDRLSRQALERLLDDPPKGLYRLKGFVLLNGGGAVEAHLVGRTRTLENITEPLATQVVAIGITPKFNPTDLDKRWYAATSS
ncbi:MAG: GTP-binding protein [Rhodospirillales bacterium]|nr:GTP-binding protein [Rhodospirillales bacterium]MDH3793080.1 GTP-binding protein [Rhodospirillales bacterium]MDH3911581.1 GTP-binding protein [Rhodospirillales bacterium]MDH3919402.1 GTP-binding protein [Rhodospirillales bacterium]MDH3968038.1 GTP-binding protein [Rhodospirillales bacterium]